MYSHRTHQSPLKPASQPANKLPNPRLTANAGRSKKKTSPSNKLPVQSSYHTGGTYASKPHRDRTAFSSGRERIIGQAIHQCGKLYTSFQLREHGYITAEREWRCIRTYDRELATIGIIFSKTKPASDREGTVSYYLSARLNYPNATP